MWLVLVTAVTAVAGATVQDEGAVADWLRPAPWEQSGKFEGDILLPDPAEASIALRNGLVSEQTLWPGGVVPYRIELSDYGEASLALILEVMGAYHEKTCIRFRPREDNDTHGIVIQSKEPGCFTYVGLQSEAEVPVNFWEASCMIRGTIIHEFMHVLGFYHQHSTLDRDNFIDIVWTNIKPASMSNFHKYNSSSVTNYNFAYDYASVMHYSQAAFAKIPNTVTIVPLKSNIIIGQRVDFSATDILKIRARYNEECYQRQVDPNSGRHQPNVGYV